MIIYDILISFQAQRFASPKGEDLVVLPYETYFNLVENYGVNGQESSEETSQEPLLNALNALKKLDLGYEELGVEFEIDAAFHILKSIRKYKKISQKELSEKTGLSQSLISSLETKTNEGTVSTWVKIADCLGVSLDLLLR